MPFAALARSLLNRQALALVLALGAPALPPLLLPQPAHSETPDLAIGTTAERAALANELSDALHMAEVVDVMRQEGLDYGKTLEDELFPGSGGTTWTATVAHIYDAGAMRRKFDAALAAALPADPRLVREAIAFFSSERGITILKLEIEARRALLDEAVEEAAKVRAEELQAKDAPIVARVLRLERAGDLIEMNVAGALNANLAFYKGMATEGGFPDSMSEEDMLAEVWGQEPDVRAETEGWLFPFMAMAYEPLSDQDLDAYAAFGESPAGKAMNAAVFAAFDRLFVGISEDLGRAAARQMTGDNI